MNSPDRSGLVKDRSARWGFAPLLKRAEFQRAAKGERRNMRCLALQSVARPGLEAGEAPRFGLTITKKVGCAVVRNRIRRRLRAAINSSPGLDARPTHDYVIIARHEALKAGFETLRDELARAVKKIHEPRTRDARRSEKPNQRPAAPGAPASR